MTDSHAGLLKRPMEPIERDLRLFKAACDANEQPRSYDRVVWEFKDNPAGAAIVDFMVDQAQGLEKVAAVYAVSPRRVRINGKERIAVQSLDTLTDVAYRGRGLFLQLAKTTYARCAGQDVAFVYGFPNENSAHGFFKRLDWRTLDPIPFLVRPLRIKFLLRNLKVPQRVLDAIPEPGLPIPAHAPLPPGWRLESVSRFTEEFDGLWDRASSRIGTAVVRNSTYLNWRLSKPSERYSTTALYIENALSGFVTWTVKAEHGGQIAYVMELIHEPARAEFGAFLLKHAVREVDKIGADVVLAVSYPHSPNRRAFRRAGFWPLPELVRPKEMHVGYLEFELPGVDMMDRRNWYLSLCDMDTV